MSATGNWKVQNFFRILAVKSESDDGDEEMMSGCSEELLLGQQEPLAKLARCPPSGTTGELKQAACRLPTMDAAAAANTTKTTFLQDLLVAAASISSGSQGDSGQLQLANSNALALSRLIGDIVASSSCGSGAVAGTHSAEDHPSRLGRLDDTTLLHALLLRQKCAARVEQRPGLMSAAEEISLRALTSSSKSSRCAL